MTGPARGRGAPPLFTAPHQAAFLQAVTLGATQVKAAAAVGISARTVRHHAQHNPDFARSLAAAREAGRWAGKPHGAYRYRHAGCRCDLCTAAASYERSGRARGPRTRPSRKDAEVIQLPAAGHPLPSLRAVV